MIAHHIGVAAASSYVEKKSARITSRRKKVDKAPLTPGYPMPPASISLPVLAANRPLRLTPTDVSQFVRLEQCERFLRFRLAERAGQKFMEDYDVTPQRITPLLSLSGHEFEEGIEKALDSHFRTVQYAARASQDHNRPDNNREVVTEARKLKPGQSVLLFQPRLEVELAGWLLRGALVVACKAGTPVGRRAVVWMTSGPPDSAAKERQLFVSFR